MTKPAILVEGLKKSYGEVDALKGIDFEVPVGTIFGLLGPNGAGKTTAVRILSTILKPSAGKAQVFGYDVVRSAPDVRMLIGLAGQSAAVDPNLTGRENLKLIGKLAQLPRSSVGPRADELLERFQLVEAGNRPIRTYSGGMRRRLDVAAALVGKPPVIFLDEPTTGLDIQSRTELWMVIEELVAEGSTVLLTTQYLEEADQLADRIAVVNDGVVVANDTAASLKARLGNTVIELTLVDDVQAKHAQQLLSGLVADHPERDGDLVRLSTAQAPKVLTQVLRSLDANGMAAAGITVRDPSLDDVFLSLTGKHADNKESNGASGRPKRRSAGDRTAPIETAPIERPRIETAPIEDEGAKKVRIAGNEKWDPHAEGDGRPGGAAAARLERMLSHLPYKAGAGNVHDNLTEVAEAALACYLDASFTQALDPEPVAGYLTLEQRFGRIGAEASPEHAAFLLIGAVMARAMGLGAWRGALHDDSEFAAGAVRMVLEGIGGSS